MRQVGAPELNPSGPHGRQVVVSALRKRKPALVVEQLSLSRLHHGQPGVRAHPEIVQGTAQFHHEITDASLPQTAPVFDNAAALDTTVDMLDTEPPLVEYLVGLLLLQGQLRTAWLLRRHKDFDRKRNGFVAWKDL